jgi:hypothetical protein
VVVVESDDDSDCQAVTGSAKAVAPSEKAANSTEKPVGVLSVDPSPTSKTRKELKESYVQAYFSRREVLLGAIIVMRACACFCVLIMYVCKYV